MKSTGNRPRVGVSSCLLGHLVRYDGQHKQDRWVVEFLSERVEWVPLCPEVAIGMGVPRPPMRLSGDLHHPRARDIANPSLDFTDRLAHFAERVSSDYFDLCGYVFKARSPSCGVNSVDIYNDTGSVIGVGAGIFAAQFATLNPRIPIIEETQLVDAHVREQFLAHVWAAHEQSPHY